MYRSVLFCSPFTRFVFNLRVFRRENLAEWQGGIVAANHISLLDPPLIGMCMPWELNYLAKSELFKVPILGPLIRYVNAIPIRRGGVDRQAIELVREKLSCGANLMIFPEGSRKWFSARPGIGQLAIGTNNAVLPVRIINSNHWLACIFRLRRMQIIIGEPIGLDVVRSYPDNKEGYRALAEYILQTINELQP